MSSDIQQVLVSSHLFNLLFPKVTTGTPQLMLDLLTSRARTAVGVLQSRHERGIVDDRYEMQWYKRMAGELVCILQTTYGSLTKLTMV